MQMQRAALEAEAERGVAALQNGDFATARSAFDIVTRSGTASAQAWLFLAQSCEGLDDGQAVLAALDQVLAIHKLNPFALLMKGDIYARNGDERAAVSFYRMGLRAAAAVQGVPGDLGERIARAEAAVAEAQARFQAQLQN